MKLKDIKIDGRYRVQKKYEEKCLTYRGVDGDSIIVTAIEGGDLKYDIFGENGDLVGRCSRCFKHRMLVPYMPYIPPYIPEEATMEVEVEPIYIWNGKKLYMVDDLGRHELTDKIYTND